MSLAAILQGILGWRREAQPAPPAPPPAGTGIPVRMVGDPPPAAPVAPAPGRVLVTPELLAELRAASPETWAPILSAACQAAEIHNGRRLAAFLGNVLHETGGLRRLRESMDYSPQGLAETWPGRFAEPGSKPPRPNARAKGMGRQTIGGRPMPARQPQIAEAVYGGRLGNREIGDAWRFRGAGPLQLTGRANWQRAADGLGISLEDLERRILEPKAGTETACLFWRWAGCNPPADAWDLREVRRRVNGGAIGLAEVEAIAERARAAIGRHLPELAA